MPRRKDERALGSSRPRRGSMTDEPERHPQPTGKTAPPRSHYESKERMPKQAALPWATTNDATIGAKRTKRKRGLAPTAQSTPESAQSPSSPPMSSSAGAGSSVASSARPGARSSSSGAHARSQIARRAAGGMMLDSARGLASTRPRSSRRPCDQLRHQQLVREPPEQPARTPSGHLCVSYRGRGSPTPRPARASRHAGRGCRVRTT